MSAWGHQLTTQAADDLADLSLQLRGTPSGMDRQLFAGASYQAVRRSGLGSGRYARSSPSRYRTTSLAE